MIGPRPCSAPCQETGASTKPHTITAAHGQAPRETSSLQRVMASRMLAAGSNPSHLRLAISTGLGDRPTASAAGQFVLPAAQKLRPSCFHLHSILLDAYATAESYRILHCCYKIIQLEVHLEFHIQVHPAIHGRFAERLRLLLVLHELTRQEYV